MKAASRPSISKKAWAAYQARLQAVADLLKERLSSEPFYANRAALDGQAYWRRLAGSGINHHEVDLPELVP